MPTTAFVALVVVLWVAAGLAAALHLGRRGYRSSSWYLLGAVLGPLFVPIALERGRRQERVVERAPLLAGSAADGAVTVVVGVDGSAESDRCVRDAIHLFGRGETRVVLVMAVDPDAVEFADAAELDRCRGVLRERAAWFPTGEPAVELVTGEPARALLEVATAEEADVVVVGRRGRGLSTRLLGSVAEHVSHHARAPVLLAGPVRRG